MSESALASVQLSDSAPISGVHPAVRPWDAGLCVGQYRLTRFISRGGMGEVWAAEPPDGQSPVALKLLLPHLLESGRHLEMFEREARLGMELRHANLLPTLDAGEHQGRPYFVMPLCSGPSLSTLISSGKVRLPPACALHIVRSVLLALQVLHSHPARDGQRHLVHCDVSPGNIVLEPSGHVWLLDFGITRAPGAVSDFLGKRGYMAPEQLAGRAVDRRADLFVASVVLSELLFGSPLHYAPRDLQAQLERIADTDGWGGIQLPELARMLEQGLTRAPAFRHADCEAMLRALDAAAGPEVLAHGARVLADEVSRFCRSRRCSDEATRPQPPSCPKAVPRLPGSSARIGLKSALGRDLAHAACAVATLGTPRISGSQAALIERLRQRAEYRALEDLDFRQLHAEDLRGLVASVVRRKQSGVLVVRSCAGERRVFFCNGTPRMVASSDPSELFGARLIRAGLVSRSELRYGLEQSLRRNIPLAEMLNLRRACSATKLRHELMQQLRERALALREVESALVAFKLGVSPERRAPASPASDRQLERACSAPPAAAL